MKIYRIIPLLLAAVLICSLLAGCGPGGQESSLESEESSVPEETSSEPEIVNWPVEIGDVVIREQPERIASLSPALTEILCDMGFRELLVAVSDYCDYPSGIADLPKTGTVFTPDCAAIAESGAQILITGAALPEAELILLQQANIEVIVLAPARRLDSLQTVYESVALICGGLEDGRAVYESHWEQCEEILETCKKTVAKLKKADDSSGKPTALFLRYLELTVATVDTLEGTLLTEIGFANAAAGYGDWLYPEDKLDDLQADYIISDREISADQLSMSVIYSETDAVTNGNVAFIDMAVFERQGMRMFRELENAVLALADASALQSSVESDE